MQSAACASHKTKAETTAANPTASTEHFKSCPLYDQRESSTVQSSMIDTPSTATVTHPGGRSMPIGGEITPGLIPW